MRALVEAVETAHTPESLVQSLGRGRGTVLLRGGSLAGGARFSLVAADPFGTFTSRGAAGEYRLGT
ncbi:MAG TPA: aminodeoxychorismate synthase, component I, partial [Verrucomicrobiota bacterium]|nr:aminodeoxychorismate synthase, component I [Verrucomicrobiota bacterium]